MKKFFALFICLLMVAVVFVGCKTTVSKSETTSAVTIKAADVSTTSKIVSTTTAAAETTTTSVVETTTKVNEPVSASWTITISGISSKDINFTDKDTAKMPTTEITVSNKKNDGTTVEHKWTGISLKAILDFYGANDYDGVKVEASDGTISDLEMGTVSDPGTIIGLKLDGQTLSKTDGIVNLIVKSQVTKSLLKDVAKITLKG